MIGFNLWKMKMEIKFRILKNIKEDTKETKFNRLWLIDIYFVFNKSKF